MERRQYYFRFPPEKPSEALAVIRRISVLRMVGRQSFWYQLQINQRFKIL